MSDTSILCRSPDGAGRTANRGAALDLFTLSRYAFASLGGPHFVFGVSEDALFIA